MPIPENPLTDAEIEELDHFLLYADGIEEAMDVATLDGFLTAIVCGPRAILPSEWMRWVWDMEKGEDTPEFKDMAQAQHIVGLMMRHMNDIAQTLHQTPEYYEPILSENPNDGDPIPILDEWCYGFVKGIDLDTEGWLKMTADNPGWLTTIFLYGSPEGWEALKTKNLSLDEHKALAGGMAGTVRNIHALSLELRLKQDPKDAFLPSTARREPVRNPGKVGRNEPCPCGSGKKFKQCHGAPGRMH